jgi:hypothetical protein
MPLVAVVIPTVGSPALAGAVASALDQSVDDLLVIVSVDGPANQLQPASWQDHPKVRLIESTRREGGQMARARGAAATDSAFVALLDDDDLWHREKLQRQAVAVETLRSERDVRHALVGCRARVVDLGGTTRAVAPRKLIGTEQSVSSYLFERTEVAPFESMLCSSMLFFNRELLATYPLESFASIHQDWEWLLKLDHDPTLRKQVLPEVLMSYTQNPVGASVSSRAKWLESYEWGMRQRESLTPRQLGDFLLTVTLTLALRQKDRLGLQQTIVASIRYGSPSRAAISFALLHALVPAPLREALAGRLGRAKTHRLLSIPNG